MTDVGAVMTAMEALAAGGEEWWCAVANGHLVCMHMAC